MQKFNNVQNIQKVCEKKSYKEPQLKELGAISKSTLGKGNSTKDNGNFNGNAGGS